MHKLVNSVAATKRAKPIQFERPRMPATAPVKHDERDLTVVREALNWTIGG